MKINIVLLVLATVVAFLQNPIVSAATIKVFQASSPYRSLATSDKSEASVENAPLDETINPEAEIVNEFGFDGLVYQLTKKDGDKTTFNIDGDVWSQSSRAGYRRHMLDLMYFANTRERTRAKNTAVGCFVGDPDKFKNLIDDKSIPINGVESVEIRISEDQKMMGIEYTLGKSTRHFRLPHCLQGAKAALIKNDSLKTALKDHKKIEKMFAQEMKDIEKEQQKSARVPARVEDEAPTVTAKSMAVAPAEMNGFTQYDTVTIRQSDKQIFNSKTFPTFAIRADYSNFRSTKTSRPWQGIDLKKSGDPQKLAQLVLDYFYDSLLLDGIDAENNLIAQKTPATKNQWCHMPWLNVGEAGREAVHGITKERDLEPTKIYDETFSADFKKNGGSNWGIGFYNDVACQYLDSVFGSVLKSGDLSGIKTSPLFKVIEKNGEHKKFPDGSASVKVLFTTAKLNALKDSFTWNANVSLPRSTTRFLQPVKLIQIDVAIKDSSIKGLSPIADNWMMMTYYFDGTYFGENSKLKNDPRFIKSRLTPFLKMRPIGVQFGFDPGTSIIFDGSKTNTTKNFYHGIDPQLLNGPADNPESNCLACHGAAGTTTRMVPGIKDFKHYAQVKAQQGTLDFSMQLAFAKRNFETRPQMTPK